MAESLEDFLNIKASTKYLDASGSFSCQECDEFIHQGKIDEDNMILMYTCSKGHNSRIRL